VNKKKSPSSPTQGPVRGGTAGAASRPSPPAGAIRTPDLAAVVRARTRFLVFRYLADHAMAQFCQSDLGPSKMLMRTPDGTPLEPAFVHINELACELYDLASKANRELGSLLPPEDNAEPFDRAGAPAGPNIAAGSGRRIVEPVASPSAPGEAGDATQKKRRRR
jgi:hypothetical protein